MDPACLAFMQQVTALSNSVHDLMSERSGATLPSSSFAIYDMSVVSMPQLPLPAPGTVVVADDAPTTSAGVPVAVSVAARDAGGAVDVAASDADGPVGTGSAATAGLHRCLRGLAVPARRDPPASTPVSHGSSRPAAPLAAPVVAVADIHDQTDGDRRRREQRHFTAVMRSTYEMAVRRRSAYRDLPRDVRPSS